MQELVIAGVSVNALTEDDAVIVTPEIAMTLMSQNNNNFRRVSKVDVNRHRLSMIHNEWCFNGDTIAIDTDGLVKDGQHRLLGCIKSNSNFKTFFIRVDNDMNIDLKKKLSFDAILKNLGYKNVLAMSATVKILYRYKYTNHNYFITKGEIGNNKLLNFFNESHGILDAMTFTLNYYKKISLPYSIVAAFYHITYNLDPDMARTFIHQLSLPIDEYSTLNINEFNAMYHLKRALSKERENHIMPLLIKTALMIKAWNYWRDDAACHQLYWKNGANAEAYPEIR